MTPVMRVLRIVFFRGPGAALARERRVSETFVRVDHADRMLGNAVANLAGSSERVRQAKDEMIGDEMVDMIRQLSARMGEP